MRVWRLSVWRLLAYIEPKSRTERPRKTKIGTEVAHVTRDSEITFKVEKSTVKVTCEAGANCGGLTHCLFLLWSCAGNSGEPQDHLHDGEYSEVSRVQHGARRSAGKRRRPRPTNGLVSVAELQHDLWGGHKIWKAIASLEKKLEPPGPSRSHISGDQNVFLQQFQYKNTCKLQ